MAGEPIWGDAGSVMQFLVLGVMEIYGRDGPIAIVAQRQQIVLMMLLLEANRPVPVERLIEAVWDDAPPATARGQIQICMSMLRKSFADVGHADIITTRTAGYQCTVADDDLDLFVFDQLVRDARRLAGEGRSAEADELYIRAIALWRGDTMTTANSRVLEAVATRLAEQRGAVMEEQAELRLRLGLHHDLVRDLKDMVARYPLRERLRAMLMTALYRSGRQAEALEVYRAGRRVLVDELGIEPGNELRRLEQAILAGEMGSDGPTAVTPAAPLAAPAPAPVAIPRLLPGDVIDFTGHAEVVAQIRAALERDELGGRSRGVPTIAITGKPGVGKTTLAVHIGHELVDAYPDGQLYVKLNGMSSRPVSPEQALERFLRAMGVPGTAVPEGLDERAELFRQSIADKKVLVVLDDAVDERQVRSLLPGSPSSAAIVTSRYRLTGLPGAIQVEVDVLASEAAMELLVKILGSSRIYTELGASMELTSLCCGLPIALRIAAARLAARPHWTVSELVERLAVESQRLDELAHRDLGIRANLAPSYEMLSPRAQRLFRLLGMPETADFPSWIAAPLLDRPAGEASDVLEELVDSHFVDVERAIHGGAVRFRLHDLVRAYAREHLLSDESSGDRARALGRTLGAWLYITSEAHRREYGGDHTLVHGSAERWPLDERVINRELTDPLTWYEHERYGIIAAVRQAAGLGLDELCWDLAITAVTLFEARSYFDDWRITHEIALAEVRRAGNRRGEAGDAVLARHPTPLRATLRRSPAASERRRCVVRRAGRYRGRALTQRNLATLDRLQGRLSGAMSRGREALDGFRATGDHIGAAHVLASLAQVHADLGEWAQAEQLLLDAMRAVDEAGGNGRVLAQIRCRLGDICLDQERHDEADDHFGRALDLVRQRGDAVGEAYALLGLGTVATRRGDHAVADTNLQRAVSLAQQIANRLLTARTRVAIGERYLAAADASRALAEFNLALVLFGELKAPLRRASTLRSAGDAYALAGQVEAARAAWVEAATLTADLEPAVAADLAASLKARING